MARDHAAFSSSHKHLDWESLMQIPKRRDDRVRSLVVSSDRMTTWAFLFGYPSSLLDILASRGRFAARH
jgi:hypothetical protein